MRQAIKKTKINYYVSLFVMTFSLSVIILAPAFIDGYLWQVMLLPLFLQMPTFFLARKMLKDNGYL